MKTDQINQFEVVSGGAADSIHCCVRQNNQHFYASYQNPQNWYDLTPIFCSLLVMKSRIHRFKVRVPINETPLAGITFRGEREDNNSIEETDRNKRFARHNRYLSSKLPLLASSSSFVV